MKLLKFISASLILTLIVYTPQNATAKTLPEINSLDQFLWEHRIIIIRAKNNEPSNIEKTIRSQKPEIDDRHILWFIVSRHAEKFDITSNYTGKINLSFRNELSSLINEDHKRVILIGKDGGIKAQSKALNLNDIFALIDTMPMRISEMNPRE